MRVILLLIVCLVPLLIIPHVLFYFDVTPKVVVLLLGTAVLVPWFEWRRVPRPLGWLLLAQAAWLGIATLVSTNRALSLTGTNWRRFGLVPQAALLLFAVVAAAWLAENPDRIRSVLAAVSATGAAIAFYGILQYFGWDPWLPPAAYHVGEGVWTIVRPPGTLGYTSYFANYEVYIVFAGAALALMAKGRAGHVLGIAAAGLASAGIVLSGTRAAILALLAGLALLAMWLRPSWKRAAILFAAILACGGLFYFSPAGQSLRSRTRWYLEDPLGGARLLLWRDSLAMASHFWLVGAGPETFSTEFPRYQSVELARAYPEFYHESPHNIFLDALVSQGLPGLVALLAVCGLAFYAAWQVRTSKPAGALACGFFAGLVSQQFTVFTLATALYFYLTLAMLVGMAQKAAGPPQRTRWPCAALVSLAIGGLFLMFGLRLWIADRDLQLVRRSLDQGKPQEAAVLYQRARKWAPPGVSSDLWYSRAMAAYAATPLAWLQSLEAGIRATQSAEDRQNAWYSLAALYAGQNDSARTEASLRAAAGIAPNWFKPHWMLAQVLRAEGRLREAVAQADRAAELDGGKHREVAKTRREIRAELSGKQ